MTGRPRSDETAGAPRRPRSDRRLAFVTAVEQLVVEEGYASLTSRRVADRAGLKHQLIFYYFRTFDDLLLEALRRGSEQHLDEMAAAFDEARPFQSAWSVARNSVSSRFLVEFMALANHNEAIRAELRRYAERYRAIQVAAMERHAASLSAPSSLPPVVFSVLVSVVARGLSLESLLGLETGHAETEAVLTALLRSFDEGGLVVPDQLLNIS